MEIIVRRTILALAVFAFCAGTADVNGGVAARTANPQSPHLERGVLLAPGQALVPLPLPIVEGDVWSYMKGTVEPPADWATLSFDDSSWLSGPSGFGFGDGDDATVLSDMRGGYSTVYTRRTFTANPASIGGLQLTVDYDDGFIVYLNGTEVARRQAPGVIGQPAAHNALATDSHEASGGSGGNPPEVIDVSANVGLLVAGDNVIAVHGLNAGLSSGDFSLIVEFRTGNAAPQTPHDPLPAPDATGVATSTQLCVTVNDPNLDPLNVTFYGHETPAGPSPPFTIVAVPDTQFYAAYYPGSYLAQTQWIVDNKATRNIAFVSQLGDCVDDANDTAQWIAADAAWDLVENPATTGLADGIPYGIAVGNHDQSPVGNPGTTGSPTATTGPFNQWFGIGRFQGRGYYGGSYGLDNDNHYELFSAGGMNFIAIHIEYMTSNSQLRQDVLAWADALLQTHANRRAILTSHYLMEGGSSNAFSNQGLATWTALKHNHNLFLMLCGHLDTAKARTDTYVDGTGTTTTHTLRSDYQFQPNGGNGWLRIMTFSPADDTIDVKTLSPTLGQNLTDADNQFTLPYDMDGSVPFAAINSIPIQVSNYPPSGQQVCTTWVGLQPNRQYEWYALVSDGAAVSNGPHWSFQTAATCLAEGACDDGNACTLDSCDSGTGTCLNLPLPAGTACLDGLVCNGNEACNASGQCVAGSPLSCDDGDLCNGTESCDAVLGCQAGSPLICNDQMPCTSDTCDPLTGCQTVNACGAGQVCTATGCLAGCFSNAECGDDDPCTTDACDLPNTHALSFDGTDDFVTMGAAPELAAAQFTLELWFKRTGVGVATGTGGGGFTAAVPLVAKGAGESESPTLNMNYFLGLVETTPGTWVLGADFEEGAGGTGPLGQNHPVLGATPVPFGQWHHAAATYDGISWRLYLDGSLDATATVEQPAASDSVQHFGLGTSLTSTGTQRGRYMGLLDEVRVWSYARTPEQIWFNMGRQIETEDNLLGRWSLNEGSGTTATDIALTPTQENGALVNGAGWSTDAASLDFGTCTHVPNLCDDGNSCTLDSCDAVFGCTQTPLPNCCAGNPTCDDGNSCTLDGCDAGNQCTHTLLANCCTQDAACSDGNPCTTDSCNVATRAAISLNGTSSRVVMGEASGLGATTFTLECWFRWNNGGSTASSGGGGVVAYPLMTKGRGESDGNNRDQNYFFGMNAGGRLTADYEEGAAQLTPGANHPVTGSTAIARNDGVWHHAAATFDGTTWRLFLDGNQDGIVVVGPNRLPRSNSIQHFGVGTALNSLGQTVDSVGVVNGYLSGDIDEVRVWNYARSEAEIQANMNRQVAAGSGLLGRWGFDEATGTLAADPTNPAEVGTVENGTWLTTGLPLVGTNSCEYAAVPEATVCNDGNACTTNDTCAAGSCVGGAASNCDDGNACTDNSCDPLLGCVLTNNSAACSDGDTATCGDACTGGVCLPGVPVAAPAPVDDSVRIAKTATEAVISWTDAQGPFNVYRGINGEAASWTYNHACFVTQFPGAVALDDEIPAENQLFYYLISRVDSCRESSLALDSSGQELPNVTPCGVAP